MAVLVVGTERDFAALRGRLFEGRVSTRDSRAVAEALRVANPHVDLDRLRPGTVLSVPDTPAVKVRGELSLDETERSGPASLLDEARTALEQIVAAAADRERELTAERKELSEALGARGLAAAARKDPELDAAVASVREAVEADGAAAKARRADLKKAHAEWSAELAELEARLR